jgi:hypothetical protein
VIQHGIGGADIVGFDIALVGFHSKVSGFTRWRVLNLGVIIESR